MGALADISIILGGLALAGFGGVTIWLLMRPRERMAALMPSFGWLVGAAAASTLWCATAYVFGPGSAEALVGRALRNIAMLGWLAATFWNERAPMSRPLRLIQRLLVTFCLVAFLFGGAVWLRQGGCGCARRNARA